MTANDLRWVHRDLFVGQLETVTFSSQQSNSTFLSWMVSGARKRRLKKSEIAAFGAEVADFMRIWNLDLPGLQSAYPIPPASGSAPNPKADDQIIDASGFIWIIVPGLGDVQLMANVFACVTTQGRGQ